ncbi:TolC family protein [Bacillus songklensis]|uniref:TolC family protein n=1 Tax=Bacillus songklensis TaxID=1069116 RepID=A0ABV8B0Y5_9BACI
MKKVITLLFAAAMASSPFADTVQAVEEPNAPSDIEKKDVAEQEREENQTEEVNVLTLEDVLKRALENNQNLVVLQYELEALKNQTLDVVDDKTDTQKDIKDLNKQLDKLKKERDRLTDAASRIMNGQERIAINDAIEGLEDKITNLGQTIKKLESGQLQAGFQQEEVKAGITLKLTSDYVNLLSLQKQMDFKKKEIQEAVKEVQRTDRRYQYGVASREEVDQAKKKQTNIEKQLEKQQNEYQYNLASLAFDIGIQYKPDLYITPMNLQINKWIRMDDYKAVIDNTFKMKRAKEDLELAKFNRDEVYKDEDSGEYAKQEQDYRVKSAEEKITALYQELTPKIEALYHNVETTEFDYEESLRQLENVKEDMTALEKRYRYGVVSKAEYEKALFQLDQLVFNGEMLNIQNFLVHQSLSALKQGYIQ